MSHTSADIVSIISEVDFLIAGIALLPLILRAVMIGQKLVSRVYKRRAFWFAGVMMVALILVLSDMVTIMFNLYPSTSLSALGILAFLAWVAVMFTYADRTILVTLEMDFHHRNTLHWRSLRTLAYVAVFANVFYLYPFILLTRAPTCSSGLCPPVYLPGLPSWVPSIFPSILVPEAIVVFIVIFGYTVSALIMGARRTSETRMKRHVMWLGLSFLIFLGFFVLFVTGAPGNLLASLFILFMVYTFYRALMSLTRIKKLEVETK